MAVKSSFGPFVLDRARRELTRDGHTVPVGHRGYALLEALLDARGEAVSKEALMERVWPGTVIEEGSLTVQVSALRRQLGHGSDAMIVTVPRIGYRLVAQPEASLAERSGPPLIAVLPFANHGSLDEDSYFANGVVDDIITALSRFKAFAVLSRSASFALKDRAGDARSAAAELGVRYALEGGVRRSENRLRVTAQLLDATSGTQLWGQRFDGPASDVFSFQDKIVESVVGVIEPQVRKAEIDRARRKPAASLDAYDLFLRAAPLVHHPGIEGHQEALVLLERAGALDARFALVPAYAAWIYEKRISLRAPALTESDGETCIALARKALTLDVDDPMVRAICGWVLYRVANDRSALHALRGAVAENPNNALILHLAGSAVGLLHGDVDEAVPYLTRAYELSPGAPEAYQFLQGLAASELIRGNYDAAVQWSLKGLATFSGWLFTYITLAAAYSGLERMTEAQEALQQVRRLSPHLTIKIIEEGAAAEDAFADAVIPGLRKAGLPEA
jgi:TolB-like protein